MHNVQQLIFVSLLSASHCMQMQHCSVTVNQLPFINSTSHYFSFTSRYDYISTFFISNMTNMRVNIFLLSSFYFMPSMFRYLSRVLYSLHKCSSLHLHCRFIRIFSFFYGLVQPKRESFMNNKALLLLRS